MKLKKISLKNIRSYSNHEIEFPEGSVLLSGDIGSGKTSILLAIEFALFGLQPGQRGSSLLRNGTDSGEVSLEIEIAGNPIIVKRRLKKGSKTISQESASLEIDGTTTEMSVTEAKTRVLALMNYPPEFLKKTNLLYRYTVYSPQEEMKQIILEDPESRLNVLRHIFGVDKYKRIKENLSTITSKIRENCRFLQARTLDLEDDKNKLNSLKSNILIIRDTISTREKELDSKILERKEKESKLEKIREKIEEKQSLENEIEKTNIMLSNKNSLQRDLEKSLAELELKASLVQKKFSQEDLDFIIHEIKSKKQAISSLQDSLIDNRAKINSLKIKRQEDLEKKSRVFKIDLCPTCLQNVPEAHKHNILNETENSLVKTDKELKLLDIEIQTLQDKIKVQKVDLETLEEAKSELEILKAKEQERQSSFEKIDNFKKQIVSLKEDVTFLESHLNRLKNEVFKLSNYQAIYQSNESELKTLLLEEKSIEISIAEIKKEEQLILQEIGLSEQKILEKRSFQGKLAELTEFEQWLSGDFTQLISFTERNILYQLRQEFSKLFNKWFEMLTSDTFFAHLDENFTPVILQGEYELDYHFLSGGERTAVALAYRLALNQTINSIFSKIKTNDLVILDEPTDGFSEQQLNKVRDVLQELNAGQLIIVSHEPKIESFVDNVIRLKKIQGQTATQ